MGLRKILLFDLGRLRPSRKSAPEPPGRHWRDLWFVWLFARRREPRHETCYLPGRYYCRVSRPRRRPWRGPLYLRPRRWQQDLLGVVSELTAIVRVNASLPQGLEAAAREEHRLDTRWGHRRIAATATIVLWVALITGGFLWLASGPAVKALAEGMGSVFGIYRLYNAELLALSLLGALTALIAFLVLRLFFRSGAREAVLLSLRDDLLAGIQLSEALSRRPRFFPAFYTDMVRAGEESGRLLECLEQLGEDTLDAVTFRGKVRQQLGYLASIFACQAFIMAFLFLKILPVFGEIAADFSARLPDLAMRVMATGDFLYYKRYGILPILALAIVYGIKCLVRPRRAFAAKPVAGLLMLVPGLRTFIVRQNAAVVSLMLEKLLRAGAPLPAALDSAARADIRPAYRRMLERIRGRVSQGEGLAAACVPEAWLLPASFRTLVAVGERSDMLPDALGTLAAQYRERTERWVRFFVDMITPVGVVALGCLTLAFEAAIFATMASLVDMLIP